MLTSTNLRTKNVSLNYITPACASSNDKPYRLFGIAPTVEVPETNIVFESHSIVVHDLRGVHDELDLEKDAFKLLKCSHSVKRTASHEEIISYAEQMAGRVQQETSADKVFMIDRQVRHPCSRNKMWPNLTLDQTKDGGWKRIRRHLTQAEALEYLGGNYRVRIMNVWRPLNDVVEDSPLALCHPSSVEDSDLVAADLVDEKGSGETYFLQHNPRHQWFWTSAMRKDEIYIFTTFDSTCAKIGTNCCIHTAFTDPTCRPDAAPRESVELRMLVLNRVADPQILVQ
ncbi:hypothetical protein EJ02DRAFT_361831 [Clathrospora elynae]|uniref:Methyltransferase n=1 Tax=Clathrospora elynae TaxID=706981 RepID=A0A6A5S732_9PLEO|nr:hypothetical protein EJ02DRAFT_361831 [Clathrospora elynae]